MHPEQLLQLWQEYREAKKPELAPTTYGREFGCIARRIGQMPSELSTGKDYRAYLLETYAPETAKRTLASLNACTKWALGEELINHNPFEGVKVKTPKKAPTSPEAFTPSEVAAILDRFQADSPYYLPWTQALFWLGARPEELRALRWEHLSDESLLIKEAFPLEASRPQTTKTRRITRFPLNSRLKRLFWAIRPMDADRSDWIFKSWEGQAFNYQNYQRRHWRPILDALVSEGKVAYYGPQYHARHTAITLMLRAGLSVQDVAYLTRTSQKMIMDFYASKARDIKVPEF